jgi:2-phospho-L-lactate guanylyltransferase
LIPMKGSMLGKQRLASCLSAEQRSRLIEMMLQDVVNVLQSVDEIDEIWLVTADARLAPRGVRTIDDPDDDLNSGLANAASAAAERGARTVVVIPGDVPYITASDVRELLAAARSSAVVVVPDREGTGTNALALTPATILRPCFGVGSCRRHVETGQGLGMAPVVLSLPSLADDVDLPAHLAHLAHERPERYGRFNLRESA